MTLSQIQTKIRFYLKKPDNERDAIIRKNVIGSLAYQILTNVIGLLIIPLSLSYIDKEKYGIWINASVMVTWLQNMNFGMGYGMQNKVAEAMAHGNVEKARGYVSIVYKFSFYIAISIFLAGLIASKFINWNKLFNSEIPAAQLAALASITFISFLTHFFLSNLIPLYNSLKQTAFPKLLGLFTNVLTIGFLFWVSRFSHNDLVLAGLALAAPTPLVYLLGTIYSYSKNLRHLSPQWIIKDKTQIKSVFNLGLKFFLMQLTSVVISQSAIFIITQYLGPEEVTPYSVINRYFYFLFFLFTIAISPYWGGFTEANAKNDFEWMRKALNKLFLLAFGCSIMVAVFVVLSFWIIPIWSNHSFDIQPYSSLVFGIAFHIITLLFSTIISTFLSALSLLRIQLLFQIVFSFVTIGASIYLIKIYNMGSLGVVLTSVIVQLLYILICGRQVKIVLQKKQSLTQ